jgi:tight adherence protein C
MFEIYAIAVIGIVLVGAGTAVVLLSLRWLLSSELASRLNTYVTEEDTEAKRFSAAAIVRSRELSGSIINRTLLPVFKQLGQLLGRLTPTRSIEDIRHQLYIAGYPLGLGAREFFGLRLATILLGLWLAFLLLRRGFSQINILLALLVILWCFIFPILWLRMMVRSRQDKIRKGLPDALDMLSVCADAGLGFDQSLQRVSEHWSTAIGLELGRVVAEMEMGSSRREALRNLADRLDVSELSSFVSVIIQSEQLGMSISETLHAQAEQMRIERRFRAQEQARTIPIKMLVPLAFLIFPAILAVILGPAIPQILDLFKAF